MKKFLIIELVLIILVCITAGFKSTLPFALCLLAAIGFPIYKLFSGMKKDIDKFAPKEEPKGPKKPTTYTEYLWLMDTEDIGNKFFRAYKEDLEETDEFHMTKKEILDEYFIGDKIYKYEPFSLPFKVENGKVYSYIEEDNWEYVGSIKKREIAKYERSKRTELYLMPNYFKKVNDETVEADSGDSYFGLEVTIEQ